MAKKQENKPKRQRKESSKARRREAGIKVLGFTLIGIGVFIFLVFFLFFIWFVWLLIYNIVFRLSGDDVLAWSSAWLGLIILLCFTGGTTKRNVVEIRQTN